MAATAEITPALAALLREACYAQLATLQPDGSPQITQVWVDTDGEHVIVNTTEDRQKHKNVKRDSRVAINVHDPSNAWRIANIRGRVVEITSEGAEDGIDALARKYVGKDYPWRRPGEARVILKIQPTRIHSMGVK
ncbi:MAG: PPOX class F420-dependent oxidoreductase [Chloroflexota bacterium]|nr:PPOX class F420-dependent oxidoreductase [Chloroflexota bacterium]